MTKAIIFDFGDVFINLDKQATYKALSAFKEDEGFILDFGFLFDYEKGLISTQDFISIAQKKYPNATKGQLIDAWNAIIKDFPKERLSFIQKLSREHDYRLFLLSNTNELHIDQVKNEMGLGDYYLFLSCFEKKYYSYEMGMRKPDAEIFEFVINENQLDPDSTLFIDDTLENIETAQKLGMQTWHLIPGQDEVTQLERRL